MMVLTFQAPLKNPSEATFTDVAQTNWAYQYIETCQEFLTGYKSPFGDTMTFHPTEAATREDIAVALVKIMGLSVSSDYSFASRKFSDMDAVSPNMRPYISKAAEQGLINGYPDGTFGPQRGISRAEAVALLNRVTKESVSDAIAEMQEELQFTSRIAIDSEDPRNITLYITATENISVTVDGQGLRMDKESINGETLYYGTYSYSFKEEGEKTFTIIGTKGTKSKTLIETAKYEIGAPILNINQTDQLVTKKYFTFSGSVSDRKYGVTLTMNGESINSGSWRKEVTLKEGANTFTFIATNTAGKSVEKTVIITFNVDGPQLTVNQTDTTVTNKYFTFSGSVSDSNYGATLTMNGDVIANYSGSWTKNVTLKEGANTFTFIATNTAGKTAEKTVIITFNIGGPQLTVNQTDTTVTSKYFTFSGSVSDSNYGATLTMNGDVITNYSGSWTKNVTLKEGENVYKFVATNTAGKSAEKTVIITFDVGGPQLTINQTDLSVTNKSFTFNGSVSDSNYGVTLTMNGNVITNYSGSWTKNVTLKEGENAFAFVATNAAGKSVTKTVTITLTVSAPTISFINCPETTSQSSLVIIGNIGGDRTGIYLFVNDKQWTVNYDGSFQKTVTLQEGDNTFVFRAVNSSGKEDTITKTITYTVTQ
jgi:hypothetical protein